MPIQTHSLTDVAMKARELQIAQRVWHRERGEDPGDSWCALPDSVKLSWFLEAAAELGVAL